MRQITPLTTIIASCLLSSVSIAQSSPAAGLRPYPTSGAIASHSLAESKRAVLAQLFQPKLPTTALVARSQELCQPTISKLTPVDESTKKAIATTTVTVASELLFQRQGVISGPELPVFSVLVEISSARVLLRHMNPRFPSDANGFSVPMAHQGTRPVRLEGKFDSDIFALVPPVRECGVQGVALCARRFTKNLELLQAPYALKSVRPLVTAKADGVYAPLSGGVGKLVVGLHASAGVKLPAQALITKSGPETLSEVVELITNLEHRAAQPPLSIESFPFQMAFESRVDFGRTEGSVRTVSKRVNIDISKITIADLSEVEVGTAAITVQGGECYLITQWLEEIV